VGVLISYISWGGREGEHQDQGRQRGTVHGRSSFSQLTVFAGGNRKNMWAKFLRARDFNC